MPSQIEMFRRDIAKTYQEIPYHNWVHWKHVWNAMMKLEGSRHVVSPWRIAWYFHDADHQWYLQEDDEERAAKIAQDYLSQKWFDESYISKVQELIMWTIFTERWNLVIPEQKLIADADLSKLWWDYPWFVKSAVRLFLEIKEKWDITDAEIEDFFRNTQPAFFKYLTDISGKEETPFLTDEARVAYPHFSKNKDTLARDVEVNPQKLVEIVRDMEVKPQISKWRKH